MNGQMGFGDGEPPTAQQFPVTGVHEAHLVEGLLGSDYRCPGVAAEPEPEPASPSPIDWDDYRDNPIQARFERFHADNPAVYAELVKLARRAKARGQTRLGIEMLFAIVRWRRMMATVDPSGFKLNDHYTSRYARLIMEREPDLDGLFQTRTLKS